MDIDDDMGNLSRVIKPPPLGSDPRFKEAVEFRENFEAAEGIDYGWVFAYATDSFERSLGIFHKLDDKANNIIKYLGGGTGLFTLAALANTNEKNAAIIGLVFFPFAASLVSIFFACLARQPNATRLPATVKTAIRYVETQGKLAEATFLGQWHEACTAMDLTIAVKAERVKYATWAFFAAILLLAIPLYAAVHHHPSELSNPVTRPGR